MREIAKLEKQIVSLEALMDPRTNKDGMDALKIKLADCEGTIAALRLEIASVRGKLHKKSKAASSSDDDISSSNALSKLAQLAGSAAGATPTRPSGHHATHSQRTPSYAGECCIVNFP